MSRILWEGHKNLLSGDFSNPSSLAFSECKNFNWNAIFISKAANSWAGFVDPFHDERYSTFEAGIPMDDERILRTSASRSSKNSLNDCEFLEEFLKEFLEEFFAIIQNSRTMIDLPYFY